MNLRQAIWALVIGVVVVAMPSVATSEPSAKDSTGKASASASAPAKASTAASKDGPAKASTAASKDEKSKAAAGARTKSSTPKAETKASAAPTKKAAGGSSPKTTSASKSTASSGTTGAGQGGGKAQAPSKGGAQAGKPSAEPPGDVDGATYVVRLRDLESRVDELKEQIRRSHTRLSLLSESVLESGVGGAEAEIVLRSAMSNAFRITNVLVVLDGTTQYNEGGPDAPHARQKVTPIFNGAIPPGDHTLQVVVKLQGHGYGVFSYLKRYTFERKGTHSFTVRQGKGVRIELTVWEKGSVTTPLEERPDVQFSEMPLEDAPDLTTDAP